MIQGSFADEKNPRMIFASKLCFLSFWPVSKMNYCLPLWTTLGIFPLIQKSSLKLSKSKIENDNEMPKATPIFSLVALPVR